MDALTDSTELVRAEMLACGMLELSRREWLARIDAAGYRLERANCFNYTNRHNAGHYRARCVSNYNDKQTGRSFAHYQERRDNRFRALQDMRKNCFVYERGRIYEL